MRERERVHLGELVGGTAGHLGDSEKGELSFQILELAQQIRLRLLSQLMNLDPRWITYSTTVNPNFTHTHTHTIRTQILQHQKCNQLNICDTI